MTTVRMTTVRMTVTALFLALYVSSAMAQGKVVICSTTDADADETLKDVNATYINDTKEGDGKLNDEIKKEYQSTEDQEFEQSKFLVWVQKRRTDGDCCCPTVNYYYRPYRIYYAGYFWTPIGGNGSQWVKVGRCLDRRVCTTDDSDCPKKRCTQAYEHRRFYAYRKITTCPYIIYSWIHVRIPDYCHCPHCCNEFY